MITATPPATPTPTPNPPANGNPGIVPPWLTRPVADNTDWLEAGHGSYPVPEAIMVSEVQRRLTHNGFGDVDPSNVDEPDRG